MRQHMVAMLLALCLAHSKVLINGRLFSLVLLLLRVLTIEAQRRETKESGEV